MLVLGCIIANSRRAQRGVIILLTAFLMLFLLGVIAFAIDFGMIVLARTDLQVAADSAALAGAAVIADGEIASQSTAEQFAEANQVFDKMVQLTPGEDVELGSWDSKAYTFTVLTGTNVNQANAVRVTCRVSAARANSIPLFFGRVFGANIADLSAQAIAFASPVRCGAFVGLNYVNISGGSYTDSYSSANGAYSSGSSGNKGTVCSNQAITMSGGSSIIKGDAHPGPGKSVSTSGGSSVTGSKDPLTTALSYAAVDSSSAAKSNANGSIPQSNNGKNAVNSKGEFNLSGGDSVTLGAGTYYFSKFTLSGGSSIQTTGKVIIYCTGDFDSSGGSFLNSTQKPTNLQIYPSGSKCNMSGGSQFYGVVYGPTTPFVRSSGSADFFGMIVAASLDLSGGGGLHYDESLSNLSGATPTPRLVQ